MATIDTDIKNILLQMRHFHEIQTNALITQAKNLFTLEASLDLKKQNEEKEGKIDVNMWH